MSNFISTGCTKSETYKTISIISEKHSAQFWNSIMATARTLQEVKDLQAVFLCQHFTDKNIEALRLLRMLYGVLEKPYSDELNILEKHPITAGLFMNEFLLISVGLIYK